MPDEGVALRGDAVKGGTKTAPKKKGGRKPILSLDLVAAALTSSGGNVSATARRFGVQRASVQDFIAKHPNLQTILADARESLLDEAESSLMKAIKDGEGWAVCFCLKTQGKKRGYVERLEHRHGGDAEAPPIKNDYRETLTPEDVRSAARLVAESGVVVPPDGRP
jgi:hypothetical protein